MTSITIKTKVEDWAIDGDFSISRGSKTKAIVVVAEVGNGKVKGHGECVPYPRYGESAESVDAIIKAWRGRNRSVLQKEIPPGAARNALDCAFWDFEAKKSGRPVYELAGLNKPKPIIASYTISLDTPQKMAENAHRVALRPLLKIKLGKDGDAERLAAVRAAAPKARLIVDANEGWTAKNISENLAACKKVGVEVVEQPLPAKDDAALASVSRDIHVCADESAFDRASLPSLVGKYDMVNIKLDKTGGLTEALATAALARQMGLGIMVGCMVSTSLSIAPAFLVAQHADYADLDGSLLLAKDRAHGAHYADGLIYPPTRSLWG
ncbi:MAG: N-acetyl-D-Glu racemase DgcA [Bdellovibrionales bacterium]